MIAYLIVGMTIFKFLYNLGDYSMDDYFQQIALYYGYLACLLVIVIMLLHIKSKQNEQETQLLEKRIKLQQLKVELESVQAYEALDQVDDEALKAFVYDVLQTYDTEVLMSRDETPLPVGIDFMYIRNEEKTIVCVQTHQNNLSVFQGLQQCLGIKYDRLVLADSVLYVSRQEATVEERDFAQRNHIHLISGLQLYRELQEQPIKSQLVEV